MPVRRERRVANSGMTATIDPRAEWKQMFDDAWRIERDYFYDPNMHGVNWKAVHDQYAKMLEASANRDDVSYVIGEMISELNVGHAYYGGGDVAAGTQRLGRDARRGLRAAGRRLPDHADLLGRALGHRRARSAGASRA